MKIYKKVASSFALISILVFGLISLSSWKRPQGKKLLIADTTQKKKEVLHSRKTIVTIDKNGKTHEQVIENFDGEEELRELLDEDMDFEFDFPSMPSLPDLDIDIPDLPHDFMIPLFPDGFYDMDTSEFSRFGFDGKRFELFKENLENDLREHLENLGPGFEARMEAMREQLEGMDFGLDSRMEELTEKLEEELSRMDGHQKFDLDHGLERLDEELSRRDEYTSTWDGIKEFETAAQQELIKDGYLDEAEKIESMSWSDDEIKFNNKALKEEHKAKYKELREKYLKKNHYRGRPE
jgi:hypothetical protein